MQKKNLIALAIIVDWLGLSVLKALGILAVSWVAVFFLPLLSAMAGVFAVLAILAVVIVGIFIYAYLTPRKGK